MDMIQKYGLTDAKTVSTPSDLNVKLRKDNSVSKQVNSVTYQSMVGSLLCAAIATRPDIAQQSEQYQKLMQIQQKLV